MRVLVLLVLALAIALVLPLPGPHLDRYVPLASVLFRRDVLEGDIGYFMIVGGVLVVYTGAAFGLLYWLSRKAR